MIQGNVIRSNKNVVKYTVIAVAIIVLVLLTLIIGYYFYRLNNAKIVYTSTINKTLDNYTKALTSDEEIKTQDTSIKLSANINAEDEEVKKVAEYINKIDLGANVDVNYDNDKIIDGQVYYDLNYKEIYLYVEDLFDKYFKMDISSSEYDQLNEMMEELLETQKEMKVGEKVSLNKASKILKEKISNKLVDEYFSKENTEVIIDGEQVKTKKFKLSLTQVQLVDIISSICKELSEDEEFLNCWEEKDKIKEGLENIVEQFDDVEKDEENKIEFGIYTKGLTNEFIKFDVAVSDKENSVVLEIVKNFKDTYSYQIMLKENEEEQQKIQGTLKIEEVDKDTYKYDFLITIPEFGDLRLNVEISNKMNQGIDTINKANSVNIEELTQNDLLKIQENIQKMKIYELINPLISSSLNLTLNDNDNNSTNTNTIPQTNNTQISSNSVKSYSGDMVVSYQVPSTFKSGSYISENYKTYEKGDNVEVTITVETNTLEDFSKEIDSSKEYFEKLDDYKNVNVSDIQTLEVNGKQVKAKTLNYTYVSSVSSDYNVEYKNMYIYYPIDNKNNLNLEIEGYDKMTKGELNQFLNLSISK